MRAYRIAMQRETKHSKRNGSPKKNPNTFIYLFVYIYTMMYNTGSRIQNEKKLPNALVRTILLQFQLKLNGFVCKSSK